MVRFSIVLVVLLVVVKTYSNEIGDQQLFMDNLKRVRSFTCEVPQPHSFRTEDLVNRARKEYDNVRVKDIKPQYTVIHR